VTPRPFGVTDGFSARKPHVAARGSGPFQTESPEVTYLRSSAFIHVSITFLQLAPGLHPTGETKTLEIQMNTNEHK
jgi:hypothetical protein